MFDHLIFEKEGEFYFDNSGEGDLIEIKDFFIFKNKNKKYLAQIDQTLPEDDQIFLLKIKKEL